MDNEELENEEINRLLKGVMGSFKSSSFGSLREMFEAALKAKGTNQTQVEKTLEIERRTLNGILDGTSKRIDVLNIVKLSNFLNASPKELMGKYINDVLANSSDKVKRAEKQSFILANFDLPNLKKAKIIDNVTDFDEIEKKITEFFGFETIFDYRRERVNPIFSSVSNPKNGRMRDYWIEGAYHSLKKINNFYPYDKKALIDLFPSIRYQSMNEDKGLLNVTRLLFKIGITLIYQPYLPLVQARGATFCVNDKPCIVLTDFRHSYPAIWFSLIHELHHVIFDWEKISVNSFHITGELDLLDSEDMEKKADNFARDYLFSSEKMEEAKPFINEEKYVNEIAEKYQVHPSIIYDFYNWDMKEQGVNTYARYSGLIPNSATSLKNLDVNPWQKPIKVSAEIREEVILNV